ncbi:putative transposase [Vibrio cholerae CP1048(21)]|nr:putative transposase [Vibrio cholerae CP1048(21)]
MSHQLTFADGEFSNKRRQTRKELFLARMEKLLPWSQLLAVIEPFYPKAGNGRRPYPSRNHVPHPLYAAVVQLK